MLNRYQWFAVLAVLLMVGCAAAPPKLNSDRIREQYGSYGVEVLRQDDQRRESSLYSGAGDARVTRTLAQVDYFVGDEPAYQEEHQAILAGASIGETFRDAGWEIEKKPLMVREVTITPDNAEVAQLMRIDLPADLALYQYQLVVSRDGQSYVYAAISELYHPDYLQLSQLEQTLAQER